MGKEIDRAASDYLAVSKNRDLYSSEEDYLRAETQAWEALQTAIQDGLVAA